MLDLTNLTAEQIAAIEEEKKFQEIRTANLKAEAETKAKDQEHALEVLKINTKTACVQNAIRILTENSLTKPADESEITSNDIKTLADELYIYITTV